MERRMCVHVQTSHEAVEVQLNGVPVAQLAPGAGERVVAVHEWLQEGRNRLALVVAPGRPAPRVAQGVRHARARLLLVPHGSTVGDAAVHVAGEVAWTADDGQAWDGPAAVERELALTAAFPRWRWLDAPPCTDPAAAHAPVLAFVQRLAHELSRGRADALVRALRWRLDELSAAYRWAPGSAEARLRAHVQALWEAQALTVTPPAAEQLVLRPVAGGRLLDCVTPHGSPVLATANDVTARPHHAWPLRVAMLGREPTVLG